jgi:ribosome-associated toxin RatA of RatAB toxin-antitoxin module
VPRIDVLDDAVIDSPLMVVYKAIQNEAAGVTHWWMPYLESKPRGNMPTYREGAVFDITVHNKGMTSKFSEKVTKIVEAKSIEVEFIDGDFVGTGEWTFEPTDGKTRVRFRFNVRTNRLLFTLLSPFVDIGKAHSETMQRGFKALNSYLSKK